MQELSSALYQNHVRDRRFNVLALIKQRANDSKFIADVLMKAYRLEFDEENMMPILKFIDKLDNFMEASNVIETEDVDYHIRKKFLERYKYDPKIQRIRELLILNDPSRTFSIYNRKQDKENFIRQESGRENIIWTPPNVSSFLDSPSQYYFIPMRW